MVVYGRKLGAGAMLAGVVAAFALLGGCGEDETAAQPNDDKHGSLLNAQEYANAPQALPVAALADPPLVLVLPSKVTLTNTPNAATQGTPQSAGSPGTCEAQAMGHGLGTYTAARATDGSIKWDATQSGNQVSAAYQFALSVSNGFSTCPAGGQATPYLSRLVGYGSPTTADVPYKPSCEYFSQVDLARAYPDAARLRIGSFATFSINQTTSLNQIKEYLHNGQAVAFSGHVFKNYSNPVLTDGVFSDVPANYVPDDGHGQLLIGYDDALGKEGALLVLNSFGPSWPPANGANADGTLYWSYGTFLESQMFAAVAYPYDPTTPTGTLLKPNPLTSPAAAVKRAFQYSPAAGADSYLIFTVHVADPVRITSVTVREPNPGSASAVGQYGQYLSNGYVYFKRTDGKQFLPGAYQLKLQAQLLDGTPVTYQATAAVGEATPGNLPAATMQAAENKLYDSTLRLAILTP